MLVRIVGMAAVATLGYWAIVGGKNQGGARNWLERGGRRLRDQGGPAARAAVSDVVYEVVEHDGGFAYKVGDVFSETFATRGEAQDAAASAARRQVRPGDDEDIEFQDDEGSWHHETADGNDRPETEVRA